MITPDKARVVERDVFGGLLGILASVLIIRGIILAIPLNPFSLIAILGIGAWSGAFLTHCAARSFGAVFDTVGAWAILARKILLHAMLWLLGTAAVIGALTALTASYDLFGRIAATTLCTAIAAGVLLACSLMVDGVKSRSAGLTGMASVVVVYLLAVPLIWQEGWSRFADEMFFTALVIALTTPAAMISLRMLHVPAARNSGFVGLAVWAFALTMWLVSIYQDTWRDSETWWESGWAMTVCGFLCAVNFLRFETRRMLPWCWLGVIGSLVACVYWLLTIWTSFQFDGDNFTVLVSVPIVVGHAIVAFAVPLRRGQGWVRVSTVAAVIFTAVIVDLGVMFGDTIGWDGLLGRLAGAGAIVAACGSLSLIVLAVLNRSPSQQVNDESLIVDIAIVCPRCHKKQRMPLGGAKCTSCGLLVRIEIADIEKEELNYSQKSARELVSTMS